MLATRNVYHNCGFRQGENEEMIVDISKSDYGFVDEITLEDYVVSFNKDKEVMFVRDDRVNVYFYPAADRKKISLEIQR